MSNLQVQVDVSKELFELGDAVATLVVAVKAKAADGLSAVDLAAAVTENLQKLLDGISGVDQLSAEAKADPQAFANAAALIGAKILGPFLPQPQPPVSG